MILCGLYYEIKWWMRRNKRIIKAITIMIKTISILSIIIIARLVYFNLFQGNLQAKEVQMVEFTVTIKPRGDFESYVQQQSITLSKNNELILFFECNFYPKNPQNKNANNFEIELSFPAEFLKGNEKRYFELNYEDSYISYLSNDETRKNFNLQDEKVFTDYSNGTYNLHFSKDDKNLDIDFENEIYIWAEIYLTTPNIENKVSFKMTYSLESLPTILTFYSEEYQIKDMTPFTGQIINNNPQKVIFLVPKDKALDVSIYLEKPLWNMEWAIFSVFLAIMLFLINLILIIIKW